MKWAASTLFVVFALAGPGCRSPEDEARRWSTLKQNLKRELKEELAEELREELVSEFERRLAAAGSAIGGGKKRSAKPGYKLRPKPGVFLPPDRSAAPAAPPAAAPTVTPPQAPSRKPAPETPAAPAAPVAPAAPGPAGPAGKADSPAPSARSNLAVVDLRMAREVRGREPVGVADHFKGPPERLYAYTVIRNNTERKVLIRWRWIQGDRVRGEYELEAGVSPRWRTWSSRRFDKTNTGKWTVQVMAEDGRVLGQTSFTVE